MSLDLKAVQVRLPVEAYEALRSLSEFEDKDLGEVARLILTEALLGKVHALSVLQERFARAIKSGSERK